MEEPEEINKRELMEYYGYKGKYGTFKYYFRYLCHWIIQTLAKISPIQEYLQNFSALGEYILGSCIYRSRINIDDLIPL